MSERGSNKHGYEKKQVSDTNLYLFSITTANQPMKRLWHEEDVISIVEELNELNDENERLKLELKKYHKRFDCHQCHYHNYDGLNIDDEYEVCDKGNDEALDDNHSCSEWEEL